MDRRTFFSAAASVFAAKSARAGAGSGSLRGKVALVGLEYAGCSVVEELSNTSRLWIDDDRFKLMTYLSASNWALARHVVEERMFEVPAPVRTWNMSMNWVEKDLEHADACIFVGDLGFGFEFELDALLRIGKTCTLRRQYVMFVGLTTEKLGKGLLRPACATRVRNAISTIRSAMPDSIFVSEPITEASQLLDWYRLQIAPIPSGEQFRSAMVDDYRSRRSLLAAPIVSMLGRSGALEFCPFRVKPV